MFFLFPVGVEKDLKRTAWLTYILIALNMGAYAIHYFFLPRVLGRAPETLVGMIGFQGIQGGEPWRVLLYTLLHPTLFSLLIQMLFLFLLGIALEDAIGRWKLALLYVLGAIGGAALVNMVADLDRQGPVVGSIGPIAAMAGAYLVLLPRTAFTIGYGYWFYFWANAGTFGCPPLLLLGLFFAQAHLPIEGFLRKFCPFLVSFSIVRVPDGRFSPVVLGLQLGGLAVGILGAFAIRLHWAHKGTEVREAALLAEEIERKRIAEETAKSAPAEIPDNLEAILAAVPGSAGAVTDPSLLTLLVASKQGRKAAAEYARWLQHDARASLSPDLQMDLATLLTADGTDLLALAALHNLIEKHPKAQQAKAALLLAGEVASRIPSKRAKAIGYLNRFLLSAPSHDDQEKAQRLLAELRSDLLLVETKDFGIDLTADFSPKTLLAEQERQAFNQPSLTDAEPPLALNLDADALSPIPPPSTPEKKAPQPMPKESVQPHGPISLRDVVRAKKESESRQSQKKAQPTPGAIPPPPGSVEIREDADDGKAAGEASGPAVSYDWSNPPPPRGAKVSPPPVLFPREDLEEPGGGENLELELDEPEGTTGKEESSKGLLYSVLLPAITPEALTKAAAQISRITRRTPESLAGDPLLRHGILMSRGSEGEATRFGQQLKETGIAVLVKRDPTVEGAGGHAEARDLRVDGVEWVWSTDKGLIEMNLRSISFLSCGLVRWTISGRRKCALDIFQQNPWLHLRLTEDHFHITSVQGLDDFPQATPDYSAAEAFRDLARHMARQAPQAFQSSAFQEWIAPRSQPLPRKFSDSEEYEAYNRWRLLVKAWKGD